MFVYFFKPKKYKKAFGSTVLKLFELDIGDPEPSQNS